LQQFFWVFVLQLATLVYNLWCVLYYEFMMQIVNRMSLYT